MTLLIEWDVKKNESLKQERDVGFEDVELAIIEGKLLDILPHFNQRKYPNQQIFIVEIRGYIYYVPFAKEEKKIFLKTIIPSRKYNKKYEKK